MENQYSQQTNQNSNQQNDPYAGSYANNVYGSSYHYGGSGSYQEPEKAPNIFQQFVLAFIPPQYNRLTKVKTGSMIGFVTLLALIATILSFVRFAFSYAAFDGSGWADAIPDFEIADGRLYIDGDEDFQIDGDGIYVYITDDINRFTEEDASQLAAQGYPKSLLIGRERISVRQNGEYQQLDFSDLGDELVINKDWIVNTFMPLMMGFVTVGYLFFFVGRVFWYFLCAAVYMLFALIIASILKKQLSAGALFRTAVYSKVLMFVVMTFLDLIPFVSNFVPFILRIAITVGFMAFAIAKLPDRN